MKIKTQYTNTCGNSYKQVYSDKCIFKKTERSQVNNLTLHTSRNYQKNNKLSPNLAEGKK